MTPLSVGGQPVACAVRGAGAPLVLLHPGLATGRAWTGVAERLEDRFECRMPDLPGHGGSGYDPARDAQWQSMDVAEAVIRTRTQPVHLVGHSFGGTVALHLALRRPELVRSLTLVEPVYFAFLHDAAHPCYAAHLAMVADSRAAMEAGDWERATRLFLDIWGGGAPLPQGDRWRRMVEGVKLVHASEPAILLPDTPDRLRLPAVAGLKPPLLLIEGSKSPPQIGRILDVIQSVLPAAERHAVRGAGHMVPITHPGEVATLIAGFADRV